MLYWLAAARCDCNTSKKVELIQYLKECNPHFVTLNETKIRSQHQMKIPNYNIIRKERENPGRGVGGGVAILIRKDIKFSQIDTSDYDEEFIAISSTFENKKNCTCNNLLLYIAPNKENFEFILKKYPNPYSWVTLTVNTHISDAKIKIKKEIYFSILLKT